MHPFAGRRPSPVALFGTFAVLLLVPVVLLGFALAASYRAEADQRGLSVARSEALLVAQTSIEPILGEQVLTGRPTGPELAELNRLVSTAVARHEILRLRLRNLSGQVVFSDDGSGFGSTPEDEALDAAHGATVERLTHLNSDSNDSGRQGAESAEIYQPLVAPSSARRIGVLELYLPYAPIRADVTAGLHRLYWYLGLGLAALYLILFAIAFWISRGLRQELALNKYLAEHDTLTDLPNRASFHDRAGRIVRRALEAGRSVSVAIVDLDRFREINDTLGHHSGDGMLEELGRRLAASVRPRDSVARLGGDEFGVVIVDDDPEPPLRRLRQLIEEEVDVSGLPLSVESSIGYAVAPEDGSDVDELLQRADVALYVAKSEHLGVARYDRRHDHYDATNLNLLSDLRRAVDAEQLVLHYQPKVSLRTGRIEAVEALVRWNHPRLGLLPPDRFIPLAEQTDVIDDLTDWVLARALRDLTELERVGARVAVAVNVSARNLAKADFPEGVLDAVALAGVDNDRLIVEITETALLVDPLRAARSLSTLAACGIEVSIDDFGVGQTSLAYLSSLPIHELKIDRSFVHDVPRSRSHAAIVRSVIELGHNLGFRVVGEGVEDDRVADTLREMGCDLLQGYWLAPPLPLGDLVAFVTGRDAALAHRAEA